MRSIFHPEADEDFSRALPHYGAEEPAVARRFYSHINTLVAEIARQPTLFRIYRPPQARRHFRRPFPSAVV